MVVCSRRLFTDQDGFAQVSDRDWLATNSSTQQRLDLCRNMIDEGRAEDIAFRCPVSMVAHNTHTASTIGVIMIVVDIGALCRTH